MHTKAEPEAAINGVRVPVVHLSPLARTVPIINLTKLRAA
jgi:hypothetical protein